MTENEMVELFREIVGEEVSLIAIHETPVLNVAFKIGDAYVSVAPATFRTKDAMLANAVALTSMAQDIKDNLAIRAWGKKRDALGPEAAGMPPLVGVRA